MIVFSPKPREPPWFAAAHPGITPRVGSGAEFRRSTSRWKSKIDDDHVALDRDLGLGSDDLVSESAQAGERGDLGSGLFGIELHAGAAFPGGEKVDRHLRFALAVVDGGDGSSIFIDA